MADHNDPSAVTSVFSEIEVSAAELNGRKYHLEMLNLAQPWPKDYHP